MNPAQLTTATDRDRHENQEFQLEDQLFEVQDKIVVVTGALGQIGAEFVKEFHRRGARVAVLSRSVNEEKLAAAFVDLDDHDRLQAHAVDITRKETIIAALDMIEGSWGVPDVLVNNAGLDTQPSAPPAVSGPFEDFPEEVFREVVDVNLVGTFLMTQAVGGRMRRAGKDGSIINVGSIYGMSSPVQDIYAYKEEQTGVRSSSRLPTQLRNPGSTTSRGTAPPTGGATGSG
jgi:NAD(P)-dependent dehydrogenase (short-subunit alcohol dehydrogenase family)